MYLQFSLPGRDMPKVGYGPADTAERLIKMELEKWTYKYGISTVQVRQDYYLCVQFDKEETYSFFFLTWEPRLNTTKLKNITVIDAELPNKFITVNQ